MDQSTRSITGDDSAASSVPSFHSLRVEDPPTTSAEVTRALIDYIVSGQVGPGDKLPSERQLCEAFGLSRSVVREGVKALSLLGLVDVRHGGGTYLRSSTSDLLPQVVEWGLLLGERSATDLVETRRHLEVITAGLAARRRTEEDLAEIEAALTRIRAATTTEEFTAADVAFHLAIAQASGNHVLANMMRSISALLRVWIQRVMDVEESFEPSYLEHVPVLDAIRDHDEQTAGAAMTVHMARASSRLLATLSEADKRTARTGEPA
ncbi:FadR/GntR family transcriptional regulator [Actinomyces sp. MRS3W]|uniref:FadR/GntR family transcriptional regulator n=1 Tax=Actinomyces sp. MRS3W TaxID=2800796 RepID=UPI0028FD9EFC|nr:FadR/GntR family transcriptional regulator [Actinomyces sp. MRS3W]MDU0347845.1 FadR/GntR family transcriptional regulator [Actinomyces sp. MRS3W]